LIPPIANESVYVKVHKKEFWAPFKKNGAVDANEVTGSFDGLAIGEGVSLVL